MEHDWYSPDMEPAEFRELGHRVIDGLADYFAGIAERPVYPAVTGEAAETAIEEPLPLEGQAPAAILDDWETRVLPHAAHLGSPRWFGFVNGSGSMIGVLADALAAAVNMNPGAWKAGPSATEVERLCIRWVAEMIGYDPECGGILTSGGTMANFTALTTALRNTSPGDIGASGVQAGDRRFRLYMSDHEGHVSITQVAGLMGLGHDAVHRVASRDDFTMDVGALAEAVDEDMAAGFTPFCVVAQVGSVNVGAIDPLDEIAHVCAERGLWFHADGACGAVGAALPELAERYRGLERADSVTLDPHKWLYIPYECGGVLVRDPERLRRAFSMTAPYLRGTIPTDYDGLDYLEYGPQMSRGFRALKLWMTIKHYGVEGYRRLMRQNISCARHLHERVEASDDFVAAIEPTLFIYSFRYAPEGVDQERLDAINQAIADGLQLSGEAFVMTSRIDGRVVLRLSVCSHRTTPADMDRVLEAARRLGEEALAGVGVP